jgi:hypothetical protein
LARDCCWRFADFDALAAPSPPLICTSGVSEPSVGAL